MFLVFTLERFFTSEARMPDEPSYVAFFGVMGATSAMVFSGWCFFLLLRSIVYNIVSSLFEKLLIADILIN